MSKVEVSVEELISTIKKSSVLNIIIEGADDIIAYRNIEEMADEQIGRLALVISAGGRDNVLKIHDALINETCYKNCIFVCDRDFWLFKGIPDQYNNAKIIFTDGYSIESDLFRDYDLNNILSRDERAQLDCELEYFKKWFAYRVAAKFLDEQVSISNHVNEVIDKQLDADALNAVFSVSGEAPVIYRAICADPIKQLRGKSYLALFVRKLNSAQRKPKHSSLSLFEHAVGARGQFLRELERQMLEALKDCEPA